MINILEGKIADIKKVIMADTNTACKVLHIYQDEWEVRSAEQVMTVVKRARAFAGRNKGCSINAAILLGGLKGHLNDATFTYEEIKAVLREIFDMSDNMAENIIKFAEHSRFGPDILFAQEMFARGWYQVVPEEVMTEFDWEDAYRLDDGEIAMFEQPDNWVGHKRGNVVRGWHGEFLFKWDEVDQSEYILYKDKVYKRG